MSARPPIIYILYGSNTMLYIDKFSVLLRTGSNPPGIKRFQSDTGNLASAILLPTREPVLIQRILNGFKAIPEPEHIPFHLE